MFNPGTGDGNGETKTGRVADLMDRVAHGLAALDDIVAELADGGDIDGLAAVLGRRAGLPAADVARSLSGPLADAASACRRGRVGVNGFSAVLRLRRRLGCDEGINPVASLADYARSAAATADRASERPDSARSGA